MYLIIKKVFFVGIIALFFLIGCISKNEAFTIKGKIEVDTNANNAVLVNYKYDTIGQSVLNNGNFIIEGAVKEPVKATLIIGDFWVDLILENDDYVVKENLLEGGELNKLIYGYKLDQKYKAAEKHVEEVYEKVFKDIDTTNIIALEKAQKTYLNEYRKVYNLGTTYQQNVIEGDYPAISKMFMLGSHYDYEYYNADKRLDFIETYEKEIGPHEYLDRLKSGALELKQSEDAEKTVEIGANFKEIIATTIDNKEVKLSKIIAKNEYTLLEFWASWCAPCRKEFPHLKKAYKGYHNKGFEIYSISLDNKRDRWEKALEEEQIPWISLVDYKAFKSDAATAYGIMGIPASFLIDKNGIIIASGQEIRGSALDEKLQELLN